MDPELKKLLDEQGATFAAFKSANDEMQAEIKKLGAADATTVEKVEKLNAALDKIQDEAKKRADDIETKLNRISLGGGSDADKDEIKAAAQFGAERGEQVDLEGYRAYKAGFVAYMRKGERLSMDERKAMSVGSDPDGGYTVVPDVSGRMIKRVYETTPMRQVASVVTIGTDRLEGFNDLGEGTAGWVGETPARPATGTPQLGKWEIPVHELYAFPQVTQKLLDDSMFNIESWLADKTADKFARTENAAFLNGTGVGQPRGLLTYPTAATADASRAWGTFQHILTGTDGSFGTNLNGADKLIDLVYSLKSKYRQNANFMMSRATLAGIRKLKDGQGGYVWQPSLSALSGGTVLGFNVVEGEDMPVMAQDSLSLAFGDFREAYQIVDRVGIRVLRDVLTNKPYVGFYTTKRVGGDAISFEAVKFLKFGD
ncbi:phage major capsid protein [Nitrobacter winogradskyi]|uniref:HK97 family phage major capsid protein n=2 Tax=Nitrobacter winogradskyi TaxID=913 RepID=A0ACC6AG40_NITWI|nr:phage major capsid protein [Nitrobacter winogradskyi]MCP1998251.1 HK97 family phage major capsid protein [Nitrobacter winogradskyi]GEC15162.1 phage capsid protein [Nitrobacter winogradskyi]